MNPLAKLAGFAVVLALVFAGAAFAGSRLDVHPGRPAADKPAHMGGMAAATMPVRGLAVSDHGLTLQLARRTAQPGRRFELAFRIADRRGQTVRDFDVEHTKRMHFIVVRRDMTGFQHLHPTQRPDGSWSVPATLPDAGSYRVFADFSVGDKPYTLADDLTVDGSVRSQALPAPADSVDVDGLRVSLADEKKELAFTVTRDGAPSPSRTTWAPRATSSRCARAISPSCTCTPTRTASGSRRRSPPRAATACSCSSRPLTAGCTPPRSRAR